MPRLVRRQPLAERIKAYLNPLDFLLWLSEEIDANDWDQFEKDWATTLGVILNLVFIVARANSRTSGSDAIDDVFGDEGGVSWLSWMASFIVHSLILASTLNAFYTFHRKRFYRFFENSIDQAPTTPSAQRVRVNSRPAAASPLRYLANALSGSAESRAHPNAERDVWELALWDPLPISLRLFCLFSPGHALVYWIFLPTQLSDPRPSVTIVTTLVVTTLLSVQMSFLASFFKQQAKDSLLVHKEVLKEYDTKFVHPRTQPVMREVGTQFSGPQQAFEEKYNKVDTFTPAVVINRGFKTSPNPNYVRHIDPEGASSRSSSFNSTPTRPSQSVQTPGYLRDASPIVKSALGSIRQPQFRQSPVPPRTGDGGSLGVYSHANSPLRKSTPGNLDRRLHNSGDFFYRERSARPSSPLKKSNIAAAPSPLASTSRGQGRRETGRF
ncbi:Nur1/Mug154 family protein [Aspergillus stella-maris]|uniref:Nur1/Mug154 family protein n=1 Tax=Aspergillus stella-maris TaxID=1810926 RepID=UPI003CCDCE34